eukprot:1825164-Pleurochrysis_carterae.AAC.1
MDPLASEACRYHSLGRSNFGEAAERRTFAATPGSHLPRKREAVWMREGMGVTIMTAGVSKGAKTLAKVASADRWLPSLDVGEIQRRQTFFKGSLTTKSASRT